MKRRLLIAGGLGLLLALVLIWFFSNVYSPFTEEIEDLKILFPEDIDYLVECADFPTFISELDKREFYDNLDRNENFQRFLSSPVVKDSGVMPILRGALREINRIDGQIDLPVDVDVLGGLSGRQIVVGGYFEEVEEGVPSFMAAVAPESSWGQVFANVLSDDLLAGFVEDRLPDATLNHTSWGVEITFSAKAMGREVKLGLATVESAVLIASDIPLLVKVVKQLRSEGGLPFDVPSRFSERWAWDSSAEGSSLRAMMFRGSSERHIGVVDRYLKPLWGDEQAARFERLFPQLRVDGTDAMTIEIDTEARLRWGFEKEDRDRPSPFANLESIDLDRMRAQGNRVLSRFPASVFGYVYAEAKPSELLEFAFEDEGFIDPDKKGLWFEELAANVDRFAMSAPVPGVAPDLLPLLKEEFDGVFGRGVGVALFKKERSDSEIDDSPGIATILRVKDRDGLLAMLNEIEESLAAKDIRAFERTEVEDDIHWRIASTAFLDDKINNRPGFALMGDWFVITNWHRILTDSARVLSGDLRAYRGDAIEAIESEMDEDSEVTRAAFHIDADALYAYMDVAKKGWVRDRTEISDLEVFAAVKRFTQMAAENRIPIEQQDNWIDQQYRRWKMAEQRTRNPDLVEREIDGHLNHFRGAFERLTVLIGESDERLRLDIGLRASAGR